MTLRAQEREQGHGRATASRRAGRERGRERRERGRERRERGRERREREIVVWKVWRRRLEGDDRGVVPKSSSKHLSKAEKPCALAWTTGVFRGLLVRSHA